MLCLHTKARRIVQSSHHNDFVIHIRVDIRIAMTIVEIPTSTAVDAMIPTPLFRSPSGGGGGGAELMLRDLLKNAQERTVNAYESQLIKSATDKNLAYQRTFDHETKLFADWL